MITHPRVRSLGSKEPAWWQTEGGVALCDNHVERYLGFIADSRARHKGPDILVGDWSTTYFSCGCCPEVLKSINPGMRLVVVLRDPVRRALSRFLEQSRNPKMALHHLTKNHTAPSFFAAAVADINSCLERAETYRLLAPEQGGAGVAAAAAAAAVAAATPAAWAAAAAAASTANPVPPLAAVMAFQCYQRSNFLGWSTFDVFLERWLRFFPPSQLLVLYMDELRDDPIAVFRKFETHLGVPPHQYPEAASRTVYNSRHAYGWFTARNKSEVLGSGTGDEGLEQAAGLDEGARRALVEFFRPHMARLLALADAGFIAQPPASWKSTYGSSRR